MPAGHEKGHGDTAAGGQRALHSVGLAAPVDFNGMVRHYYLRCGHCGQAMGITFSNNHKRRYRYYLCNHAAKNGYDTCPVKSVAAGEIEAAVIEQLRRVFRSPDMPGPSGPPRSRPNSRRTN